MTKSLLRLSPIILMLSGCATSPPLPPHAPIAQHLDYRLPPPQSLGRSIEAAQMITARYGDQTIAFETHLSISRDGILLIGLDGFGRRAFRIEWRGDAIDYQPAPWLPSSLKAENMLADITLMFWPAEAVRQGLPDKAQLEATATDRTISLEGQEILHITYKGEDDSHWSGEASYHNDAFGYELDVQSTRLGS